MCPGPRGKILPRPPEKSWGATHQRRGPSDPTAGPALLRRGISRRPGSSTAQVQGRAKFRFWAATGFPPAKGPHRTSPPSEIETPAVRIPDGLREQDGLSGPRSLRNPPARPLRKRGACFVTMATRRGTGRLGSAPGDDGRASAATQGLNSSRPSRTTDPTPGLDFSTDWRQWDDLDGRPPGRVEPGRGDIFFWGPLVSGRRMHSPARSGGLFKRAG